MPDLLIRGLSSEGKEALVARAARNGRSQQAEALSILEKELRREGSWVAILRNAAQRAGGFELEQPARHVARAVDAGEWQ